MPLNKETKQRSESYRVVFDWLWANSATNFNPASSLTNVHIKWLIHCLLISSSSLLFHATSIWGCRIHWLLICRGVRPPPNECPGYDTKQSDGEVPTLLELWGMRSTPSLPSLPGPLWPGVVAPDRALSIG